MHYVGSKYWLFGRFHELFHQNKIKKKFHTILDSQRLVLNAYTLGEVVNHLFSVEVLHIVIWMLSLDRSGQDRLRSYRYSGPLLPKSLRRDAKCWAVLRHPLQLFCPWTVSTMQWGWWLGGRREPGESHSAQEWASVSLSKIWEVISLTEGEGITEMVRSKIQE